MIVRKLRLQKGWSQDQLAQLSGLSIRTIQRIERGNKAGLESLKSLAAVFEIELSKLNQDVTMTKHDLDEEMAIEYVRDIKGFYSHLLEYVVVVLGLLILNLILTPDNLWVKWVALGWGIGVLSHGLNTFEVINLFGPDWEKKQIEKRLGKRL